MSYKQYFNTYCQSVAYVWQLDSNKKGVRVARYIAKGIFQPVAALKWAFAIRNLPELRLWFGSNPRLLLKPSRHYINRNYNFDLRIQIISNHYAMLMRLLSPPSFEALAEGNHLVLATLEGKKGQGYEITIWKTDKFDREGELVLQLREGTECLVVFSLVFSLNIYGDRAGVEIGCIQGPKGKNGYEIIKRATKCLYGVRPKNLLVDALYALASAWNLTDYFGVCNTSRIYKCNQVQADYDAFWLELGSTLGNNGMFRLPAKLHHHQLSEVQSHHRSEYRKRIKLRDVLDKQISLAASDLGTSTLGVDKLLPRPFCATNANHSSNIFNTHWLNIISMRKLPHHGLHEGPIRK